MPRPCTLAVAGSPRAFQPIDVFERVSFGMCHAESHGIQRGTVARESLRKIKTRVRVPLSCMLDEYFSVYQDLVIRTSCPI